MTNIAHYSYDDFTRIYDGKEGNLWLLDGQDIKDIIVEMDIPEASVQITRERPGDDGNPRFSMKAISTPLVGVAFAAQELINGHAEANRISPKALKGSDVRQLVGRIAKIRDLNAVKPKGPAFTEATTPKREPRPGDMPEATMEKAIAALKTLNPEKILTHGATRITMPDDNAHLLFNQVEGGYRFALDAGEPSPLRDKVEATLAALSTKHGDPIPRAFIYTSLRTLCELYPERGKNARGPIKLPTYDFTPGQPIPMPEIRYEDFVPALNANPEQVGWQGMGRYPGRSIRLLMPDRANDVIVSFCPGKDGELYQMFAAPASPGANPERVDKTRTHVEDNCGGFRPAEMLLRSLKTISHGLYSRRERAQANATRIAESSADSGMAL